LYFISIWKIAAFCDREYLCSNFEHKLLITILKGGLFWSLELPIGLGSKQILLIAILFNLGAYVKKNQTNFQHSRQGSDSSFSLTLHLSGADNYAEKVMLYTFIFYFLGTYLGTSVPFRKMDD
jgi:hypothetical protein